MPAPPEPRPPLERFFLPWDRPLLPQVARLLVDSAFSAKEGRLDLRSLLVVLPGARAGRRLLELLVEEAEGRGAPLLPPRAIVTPGALPELLYDPARPLASPATCRQAWARSVTKVRSAELERVFPLLPQSGDTLGRVRLARVLDDLAQTVGAGGWTFKDVARRCREGLLFSDHERWGILATVQARFWEELKTIGRMDRGEARREALSRGGISSEGEVVLVGLADLPAIVRRFLVAVETPVRAMVHAPDEVADGFDELGCVEEAFWSGRELPLADEVLAFRDRPQDQADEVMKAILELGQDHGPEDITLGVPSDGSVTPFVEHRLSAYGLTHRVAEGRPLRTSGPYRLLAAVADYLGEGKFHNLADLLRHPALCPDLVGPDAPDLSDAFFKRRLPAASPSPRSRSGGGQFGGDRLGAPSRDLRDLVDRLEDEDGVGRFRRRRRLSAWMPEILAFLSERLMAVGSGPHARADQDVMEACRRIREKAEEILDLPERFDEEMEGSTALRVLLDELKDEAVPPRSEESALELVGWLEVHLDDAPALVLTGLNDPGLPEAVNAHPFLPDRLRRHLGLESNDSRFARDAYRLTATMHSRTWSRLVVGRRDTSGDPLRPSRLLFTGPSEEVARRVQRFATPEAVDPAGPAMPPLAFHPGPTTRFSLPPEPELAVPIVPQPFPVTWFRAFIDNPFLWALERVLGLAEVDDQAQEMDGGAFGDLAHRVLDAFGRSDELHSQDVDLVKARLSALLDRESDKRFGPDPLPAVGLQMEQLRARLEAFAQWQVRHLREGWRVAATEVGTPPEGVAFDVDGVPFFLSGRIDRVDQHPERGEWMVLDYKTGDADTDPERSHRRRSEWKDLQLPLYRHLLGRLEEPLDGFDGLGPVALGYLRLSKGREPVRESLAPWTVEELESADEAARDVVRRLREGGAVAHDPSARVPGREGSLELLLGKWTLVAFERSAADGE